MSKLMIEARIARAARKRIDAERPNISPIAPKMTGEIAPGKTPKENRIPKARPLFFAGLTSVINAVSDGTPKKKEKPTPIKIAMSGTISIEKESNTKQGAINPVEIAMNGTRFPRRSDRGAASN
jgi:hypothetical protein